MATHATECTTSERSLPSLLTTLPSELPLDFLKTITDQFSEKRILGIDAFGTTYEGVLPDGQRIVVKRLAESGPVSRDKVISNEVTSIMALRHENVVRMIAFCVEGQKKVVKNSNGRYVVADIFESLLCYEHLPLGSLNTNLFQGPTRIDWSTRFKIIKGICRGLSFVHSINIVHMDLNLENILLDNKMEAKIANFGLSRLLGEEQTRENTQNVVGSYGYMAPEYLYKGEISTKSDIYSLGLIIVEITTGEKNVGSTDPSSANYIKTIRERWTDGHIASQYSRLYADNLQEIRICIQIGLDCVAVDRRRRPSIERIVDRLNAI